MKLSTQKKRWLIAVVAVALIVPALWGVARSDDPPGSDTQKYRDPDGGGDAGWVTAAVVRLLYGSDYTWGDPPMTYVKPKTIKVDEDGLRRIIERYEEEIERIDGLAWWYSQLGSQALREGNLNLSEDYFHDAYRSRSLRRKLDKELAYYRRKLEERLATKAAGGGCFTADTAVLMADGSSRDISRIREGDMVVSYNVKKGVRENKRVLKTYTFPSEGYYLINGRVKATAAHPFLMAGPGVVWKKASELKVGDSVKSAEGSIIIRSIERVKDVKTTHNFRVADNKAYIVSGGDELYVVHNGL